MLVECRWGQRQLVVRRYDQMLGIPRGVIQMNLDCPLEAYHLDAWMAAGVSGGGGLGGGVGQTRRRNLVWLGLAVATFEERPFVLT